MVLKFKNSNEGQSLIEVVLAIAVAVISISALVFLAISALRNSQSALSRSVAEKLSLGGLEAARVTRDIRGFVDGFSPSDDYYAISNGLLVTCGSAPNCDGATNFDEIVFNGKLTFYRKIYVSNAIDGKREVRVEVMWEEGAGERKVYLSGDLYDWQ